MAENARKQNEQNQLDLKVSEGYKPQVVPYALKVINGSLKTFGEVADRSAKMTCEVVVKEFLAVGTRHSCPSNENAIEIPKAIEQLISRLHEIPNRTGRGLILHAPSDPDATPIWYVMSEVSELTEAIPDGMFIQHLPQQTYVSYTHNGSGASLGDTYSVLHDWILKNGEYDQGFMVERQADSFDVFSDDFVADVYIPFIPNKTS